MSENRRKIIWSAFSELWLDNEIDQSDLERIAQIMKESNYSLIELKSIYQHEVAPVVYHNLLGVAGVWGGFDESWLFEEIQRHISKKKFCSKFYFYLKKPIMFYATKQHWATLEILFLSENHDDKNN